MVLFNYSTKELTAKVVYYGPGLCGKTTNLQWVHEKLPIKNKGKMLSLATETDRTLFFDFLPIEIGTIRGMKTRIQLYTVPGQVFYNATRRMVLKGADAVVFVCDSQEAMLDANLESYENMRQNLEANEIVPEEIPLVLQYNKRDLPNALPIEILNERLNPSNVPFFEAIAVKGVGVEDTLKAVTKLVFKSLSARYGDGAVASSPPGRAPGPPRIPPVQATPGPPLAITTEDLLGELAGAPPAPAPSRGTPPPARPRTPTPPPAAPAPPSDPPLPRIELDDIPVAGAFHPEGLQDPVTAPKVHTQGPGPSRPPIGAHQPQNTLVSNRDEAEELRRRIATPGTTDDVEMDLEEIEELDAHPTHGKLVLAEASPAEPSLELEKTGATEVEVPIDIEVSPGTTRIVLNLRLVLNLRQL
jgi:signal recognition particle receptor subunit beta